MAIESEAEQLEAIKEWLRQNGMTLVVGVVVGLAALAGWHFWQQHQASQAQGGATQYQRLLSSIDSGKTNDAKRIADSLVKNYAGTPYAAQGDLAMASYLVNQDKLSDAEQRLAWVTAHASEKNLRSVARLRQARVLRAMGKDARALKLLASAKAGRYKPLYLELKGDILAGQGKDPAAIQAYQSALAALPKNDQAAKAPIQHKLQDLGGAGAAS